MSTEEKVRSGPGGPHRKGAKGGYLLPRGMTRLQFAQSGERGTAHLNVPRQLARLIGRDRVFRVELTEEGVLFRYVEGGEPVALPAWLLSNERGET